MTTPRTSVEPASAAPSAVIAGIPGLCSADAASARARASALRVERPPLAAQAHERLRRRGQGAELLDADLVAAQRRLEVVPDDAVELERPAGQLEAGIVEVEVALLGDRRRELDAGAGELERRRRQAQLHDGVLAE